MSKFATIFAALFVTGLALSGCGDTNTAGEAPTDSPVENPAPTDAAPTENAPAAPAVPSAPETPTTN